METVEKELIDGWNLIAHPNYTVYSNAKSYVVMTADDEMALKFSVNSDTLSITNTSWDTKIDIRSDNKTITITTDPTYDEDEAEE